MSPSMNKALLCSKVIVRIAVWRVLSVAQTDLFHTRHICLYKNIGNLPENWQKNSLMI